MMTPSPAPFQREHRGLLPDVPSQLGTILAGQSGPVPNHSQPSGGCVAQRIPFWDSDGKGRKQPGWEGSGKTVLTLYCLDSYGCLNSDNQFQCVALFSILIPAPLPFPITSDLTLPKGNHHPSPHPGPGQSHFGLRPCISRLQGRIPPFPEPLQSLLSPKGRV